MEIDLAAVLEEPTTMRSESNEGDLNPTGDDFNFDNLEFEESEEEHINSEINSALNPEKENEDPEPTTVQITPQEAKEGAEMLVDLIDTFNSISLTPLARWKLKKKLGGSKVVKRMQHIFQKQLNGEKIDEKEKQILWQYNAYLKDKEEIENTIPFTTDERDKLVRSMTAYFQKKNIKFSGDYSFWGELIMIEGMKIMGILTM